jgi:8-oxo-dGTP pyrophosphatase MutT (NUDIX family)
MTAKRVAGTLMEHGGKLLILLRDDGMWGLPAGGVEPGEDELTAAVREIAEETGYTAKKEDMRLEHAYDQPFWSVKNNELIFTLFRLAVPRMFKVRLDPKEHTDFRWVTPEEAYILPNSIPGLKEVFKDAYPQLS